MMGSTSTSIPNNIQEIHLGASRPFHAITSASDYASSEALVTGAALKKYNWQKVLGNNCLETRIDNDGVCKYRGVYRHHRSQYRTRECSSAEEALRVRDEKIRGLRSQGETHHQQPNQHGRSTYVQHSQHVHSRFAPYPLQAGPAGPFPAATPRGCVGDLQGRHHHPVHIQPAYVSPDHQWLRSVSGLSLSQDNGMHTAAADYHPVPRHAPHQVAQTPRTVSGDHGIFEPRRVGTHYPSHSPAGITYEPTRTAGSPLQAVNEMRQSARQQEQAGRGNAQVPRSNHPTLQNAQLDRPAAGPFPAATPRGCVGDLQGRHHHPVHIQPAYVSPDHQWLRSVSGLSLSQDNGMHTAAADYHPVARNAPHQVAQTPHTVSGDHGISEPRRVGTHHPLHSPAGITYQPTHTAGSNEMRQSARQQEQAGRGNAQVPRSNHPTSQNAQLDRPAAGQFPAATPRGDVGDLQDRHHPPVHNQPAYVSPDHQWLRSLLGLSLSQDNGVHTAAADYHPVPRNAPHQVAQTPHTVSGDHGISEPRRAGTHDPSHPPAGITYEPTRITGSTLQAVNEMRQSARQQERAGRGNAQVPRSNHPTLQNAQLARPAAGANNSVNVPSQGGTGYQTENRYSAVPLPVYQSPQPGNAIRNTPSLRGADTPLANINQAEMQTHQHQVCKSRQEHQDNAAGVVDIYQGISNHSLRGHKVQLTNIYDQQLLRSGCNRIELLRQLGAGTHSSVYMGYSMLTASSSNPTFDDPSSSQNSFREGASTAVPGGQDSRHAAGQSVLHLAVKVYSAMGPDFKRELRALQLSLGKRFIVQLLAVGYVQLTSEARRPNQPPANPCLVLQLAERTLDDISEPCSEDKARQWIKQLLQGLAVMHSLTADNDNVPSITHRNLQPSNILLDEHDNVMIADFSCCNMMGDGGLPADTDARLFMATLTGSECYMAPEIINPTFASYDRTVDSHSVGVIAVSLLLGGTSELMKHAEQLPAGVSDQCWSVMHFLQDIALGHEHPKLPVSGNFRNFIECSTSRRSRKTPEQLLQHPWIVDDGT